MPTKPKTCTFPALYSKARGLCLRLSAALHTYEDTSLIGRVQASPAAHLLDWKSLCSPQPAQPYTVAMEERKRQLCVLKTKSQLKQVWGSVWSSFSLEAVPYPSSHHGHSHEEPAGRLCLPDDGSVPH